MFSQETNINKKTAKIVKIEFPKKQKSYKYRTMVLHNHKRLWTRLERRNNYEHGMMYCAVHGFEKFKKQGENYLFIFNLTNFLFSNFQILPN